VYVYPKTAEITHALFIDIIIVVIIIFITLSLAAAAACRLT
jgi:hypothetical protein